MDVAAFFKNSNQPVITYRYNSYALIESYLKELSARISFTDSSLEVLGTSVLERSIYGLKIGSAGPKILMWSQMHGNESTMTRSLFLWLESVIKNGIIDNVQLYIIPVLNPDGNDHWIRNNANDVDLNRDAQDLSQPESQILNTVIERFKPDVAFNLHDQRTIYGSKDGTQAMQLSFLAPAADVDRSVTAARLRSMELINEIVSHCSSMMNHGIGTYDDAYNLNCVGDALATLQIPVVLFEAGHAGDDYNRDTTTVIMANALLHAVEYISSKKHVTDHEAILKKYTNIPQIASTYCDVYLKNVASVNGRVNIAIMYKEVIENEILYYVPYITSVNDDAVKNGHRVIDLASYELVDLDFEISTHQKITSSLLEINSFC